MIITPKHDENAPGGRIMNTIGAPNRITEKILNNKKKKWEEKFSYMNKPFVTLLVGGDTKKGAFTEEHSIDLANKISMFCNEREASLLITNSRRTSSEATEALKRELKTKFFFHDYHSTNENPYFGYLALSDAIIASGDSISMCSEACTTGKHVYIYAPENITPEKHQRFHKNLYDKGYAKPLTGEWFDWDYEPLNDAQKVAKIIRDNYFCNQ